MRLPITAAMAILAAAGCSPGGTTPDDPEPEAPRTCPRVHSKLREIPILYGELKQDPETVRARWELKFAYGGPATKADAPRSTQACDDCQYVYDPRRDLWERESRSTDRFLRPLCGWIASAPQDEARYLTRPVLFRQAIRDEQVVEESYEMATAWKFEEIWGRVRRTLDRAQGLQMLEDESSRKRVRAALDGFAVEAVVDRRRPVRGTVVRLRAWK